MQLNEQSKIIYKNHNYNYTFLQRQIDYVKNKIVFANMDGQTPVVLALQRTPMLISCMFALLDLHIPFLPVDINQPAERICEMLEQANAECVITDIESQDNIVFDNLTKIYCTEDEADNYVYRKSDKKYNNDIAYVLFTSGTTGKPKGVEVTREGLSNFILGVTDIIDFSARKKIISLTSFTFDIFFLETILALSQGLTVILASEDERKNPKKIEELILNNNVDMMQITPSMMELLYIYNRDLKFVNSLSEIMLGGEKLPQHMLEILQGTGNVKIYNMYGPTETTIWSTVADLTTEDYVHIGKPIKNTKIYLMDENLNVVPNGESGEICIAGVGLANGYVNSMEQTEKAFIYTVDGQRVYRTGDLGKRDSHGKLICLGRKDSQVKIHGHRIELEDIECNIKKMKEIVDCITCVEKNKGDILVAFYKASECIEENKIRNFAGKYLPEYMLPVQYVHVKEFIYNTNGKIDRKAMLENYAKKQKNQVNSINNQDECIRIIRKCINKAEMDITVETMFEDMNLDSIEYVQMIVELEDFYSIEFEPECMAGQYFEKVSDLKDYIKFKCCREVS